MEWLDEVELYLHQRLLAPGRKSDAILLLNRYPIIHSRLREFVQQSMEIIHMRWTTPLAAVERELMHLTSLSNHNAYQQERTQYLLKKRAKLRATIDQDDNAQQAESTLTSVSIAVGKNIFNKIHCSKEFKDDTFVKVGDFIIEGFFQCNFINIITPPQFSSTPIIIKPTERWSSVIEETYKNVRGIYFERPTNLPFIQKVKGINGMVQEIPMIKRWVEEDEVIYNAIVKHSPAHRAAEKLAKTGWQINERVLAAVSNMSQEHENESKRFEYDFINKYANEILDHLKDKEVKEFFFAPEFDYRGRVYFNMPYLNFQGSDIARGLLLFSKKKYVSDRGLRWMKIHAAASYNQSYSKDSIPAWCTADYLTHLENEGLEDISVDKMTLEDRELWVDNNWQLLQDTYEQNIIHDCEKPVSFLAVAIEIMEYHKANGFYFSALPVPVDGSNNGWQHLGAMSKDEQTGKLVGLVPVDIQQDFYVQTAKKLIEITKDQDRSDILAAMPMKKIRKGISKRGSMTRAYSAGAQKIAENMYQDCKSAGYVSQYNITEQNCKGFARDLVKAIDQVCPGPLQTMKYLQNLAADQLEDGAQKLTWVTPSGFPVIYECYHENKPTVRSKIRGVNPTSDDKVGHKIIITSDSIDKRGFMCGISPNFVHSQDASHMHLVIDRFDGDFGAVHDSFSTHADDVDELVELTKNVFIEMYSHENYFNKIKDKLGGNAEQPQLGTLDIKEITNSDYFFA